jgi:hypothetical protein
MPKETNEMEKSVEAKLGSARGEAEGARRATGASPRAAVGPLGPGQRGANGRGCSGSCAGSRSTLCPASWGSRSTGWKPGISRRWRASMWVYATAGIRFEQGDLDAAMKRIRELSMENELLRMRCEAKGPLARRRSTR